MLDERVFPSLGILRVAACLEQAGVDVEVLDLSGVENYLDVLVSHVTHTEADMFGITATTPQMPAASRISTTLLEYRKCVRRILGGPHVTLVHAAMKSEEKREICGRGHKAYWHIFRVFDAAVFGDGDRAVFDVLGEPYKVAANGDDPDSELFLTNAGYDAVPWPARHLIDLKSYHYTIDGEPATSAIFQLGCPMACTFCGGRESPSLRRIRMRSIDNIIGEMRMLHEVYGYKALMAYDDELNINPQMGPLMWAISELSEELGFRWKLRGFIKAELFTEEQAVAMRMAGFEWILVGFESGSPRILDNINKKATREDNTRCLHIARKYGLKVKALMSLGHAGECCESFHDTREWLLENKPDDFDVTCITTYPGTPYFDHAVETGPGIWTYTAPRTKDRLHAFETDFHAEAAYYKGTPGEYKSFVFTDKLSCEQLVKMRDDLETEVREKLGIPFNAANPGVRFEASMGQLPGNVLRKSR